MGVTVATGVVAAVVTWLTLANRDSNRAAAGAMLAAYTLTQLVESLRAVAEPGPEALQRIVGAGVLGIVPIQSALLMSAGRRGLGVATAAVWPVSRLLARRRSVT